MNIGIRPLRGLAIVKRDPMDEKASAHIFMPDTQREKSNLGTVIALGAPMRRKGREIPWDVEVGDRIIMGVAQGHRTSWGEEEYFWVRQVDMLGRID